MDEQRLAELERRWRDAARESDQVNEQHSPRFSLATEELKRAARDSAVAAEMEYLRAKAEHDREQRDRADAVSARVAGETYGITEAARMAAEASAEAARWAKWAAVFTAVAAAASLIALVFRA